MIKSWNWGKLLETYPKKNAVVRAWVRLLNGALKKVKMPMFDGTDLEP